MRKEHELWQFVAERLARGENIMLLVVAESSGSSPGRQGYKMAVGADGELCGSIGGGVMEVNLVEQSREILLEPPAVAGGLTRSSQEQVHRKDVPNSSGMICSGRQTVIFQLITPNDSAAVENAVASLSENKRDLLKVSSNTFDVQPSDDRIGDFEFQKLSDTDFVYIERLGPKNDLYIVGGGHCALALSELMSKMDFRIHIFDDRPELNTLAKNEFADEITVIKDYESVADHVPSSPSAYVVVMTLGYKTDAIVMHNLIDKDLKYFGVLGSKAKMATLLKELRDDGLPAKRLETIHTPVGISINSRTPEEIAVSIAAEIISVKNL